MSKIKQIYVDNELINLKYDKFSKWRVVYPYNQDGTFNWFNFLTGGTWFNLLKVILFIALVLFFIFVYYDLFAQCQTLISNQAPAVNLSMLP